MVSENRVWFARTLSVVAGIGAAMMIIFGGTVSPAAAADGIEFSRDGVHYSSNLSGSLLDKITISVPGDHQTAELYLRNAGPVAGFLRVSLSDATVSDSALGYALTVSAGTPLHPGSSAALADAKPCRVLTEGDIVPPGGVVKLSTSLRFGDLTGSTAQRASATFSFRVSLNDVAAGALPPTECSSGTTVPISGGDGTIALAMTGAESPMPLIIAAASILGIGLFFVVAAKRRREMKE